MKWIVLFITLISVSAVANEIDNVFGSGVFETKWGLSIEEVLAVHPKGEKKKYGDVTQYQIEGGREVLGAKSDRIVFGFDSEGRLGGVSVYYDGSDKMVNIFRKLETLFGEHESEDGVMNEAPIMKWEGEEIALTLMLLTPMFGTETYFSIVYRGLKKPSASKSELGF